MVRLLHRSDVCVAYLLMEGTLHVEMDCVKIEMSCNFYLRCKLPIILRHVTHDIDHSKWAFINHKLFNNIALSLHLIAISFQYFHCNVPLGVLSIFPAKSCLILHCNCAVSKLP